MSTQTGAWQGAKHSRGGPTASICNAARRPFACSPFGLAGNRAAGVVAQDLRGAATRRPARLACRPIPGQCVAPCSVNRP